MNDDSEPMVPSSFSPEYRAAGVLLHVASLPSPYGIGDVGPVALAWVDHLHEGGQTWWQALPLGPTGYGNSPYQSLSSFAGNELLVSPDGLIEDGLLRASDCGGSSFPAGTIDYNTVIPFKHRLLQTAWTTFRAGARRDLRPDYQQFCDAQRHWLDDYAVFRALKAAHNDAYYLEWPGRIDPAQSGAFNAGAAGPGGPGRSGSVRAIPGVPPSGAPERSRPFKGSAPNRRPAIFCFP